MYTAQVLDHFQHPRLAGDLPGADATAQVTNPGCGDVMQLSVGLEHGRIVAARFKAKGCVPALACGSRLAELLQGRSLEEARRIQREEIVSSLGGLSPESMHASHLAMDALAAVLRQL
jgi:nitrogen fixation NifU-like protein